MCLGDQHNAQKPLRTFKDQYHFHFTRKDSHNNRRQCIASLFMWLCHVITDWNQTSYDGVIPFPPEMQSSILPLVLNYLCPLPVSMIGLGAISAAVMSSADSVNLAASSVAAKNIYSDIFRPNVSCGDNIDTMIIM